MSSSVAGVGVSELAGLSSMLQEVNVRQLERIAVQIHVNFLIVLYKLVNIYFSHKITIIFLNSGEKDKKKSDLLRNENVFAQKKGFLVKNER
jgi:predicted acyltransferase